MRTDAARAGVPVPSITRALMIRVAGASWARGPAAARKRERKPNNSPPSIDVRMAADHDTDTRRARLSETQAQAQLFDVELEAALDDKSFHDPDRFGHH